MNGAEAGKSFKHALRVDPGVYAERLSKLFPSCCEVWVLSVRTE